MRTCGRCATGDAHVFIACRSAGSASLCCGGRRSSWNCARGLPVFARLRLARPFHMAMRPSIGVDRDEIGSCADPTMDVHALLIRSSPALPAGGAALHSRRAPRRPDKVVMPDFSAVLAAELIAQARASSCDEAAAKFVTITARLHARMQDGRRFHRSRR